MVVGNGAVAAVNGVLENGTVKMQNNLASYRKGVGIWIEDADHVWITATVENEDFYDSHKRKSELLVRLENGQVRALPIRDLANDLPPLRNPDFLIDTNDLTSLSYLHEPDVLHSLKTRFGMSHIYTYCGIILVAINPYSECGIYGANIFDIYRDQNVRQLDPHIYAVAEEAFASLTRYNKSQSIIISGESGAGKTVSAKHVMQYLAEACSRSCVNGVGSHLDDGQQRIEARVLASNPIMEAIGNAKTIRNDNSSRFGKFIQILFDSRSVMCGALMRTYLLEKSRVVGLNEQERNYHIFYQLCGAREMDPMLQHLELADASEFFYLNTGSCTIVDSIDDAKNFISTRNAMIDLGFSTGDIAAIFRILAGLLHFGNVKFDTKAECAALNGASSVHHLRTCCKLWEIDEIEMREWLKHKRFRAPDTDVKKPFSLEEANGARDASAKMIYARLFDKIVTRINQGFGSEKKAQDAGTRFVGVLDIYGFEIFTSNSFEQLCINYANEMLQQQFTQHVFKLEQQEYEREDIEWSRIDFSDNQACLDLIESRLGILDLLDQECKKAPSTDKNWYTNMTTTTQVKSSPFFAIPRVRGLAPQFIIHHFASEVTYDVSGFVEKNLDSVNAEQVEVLKRSKLGLLSQILADCGTAETNGTMGAKGKNGQHHAISKKSIASQFRESLKGLKTVLDSTMPHYVRCIKPNDDKAPWTFCPVRSVEQLRACGVLETIRISAAGFPSRWAFEEFCDRYRMLTANQCRQTSPTPIAKNVVADICKLNLEKDKYALGRTKVFFRTGQVALLEGLRSEKLRSSAIMIQKTFRGFVARKRYARIRNSVKVIQAVGRSWLAWRFTKFIQMHRAAIVIQSKFRSYIQRRKYFATQKACVAIQACWRAKVVRLKLWQFRAEQKIILAQKHIRGYLARQRYRKIHHAAVVIQCCFRRYLAKKEFKRLKVEAKSVNHLQNLNKGLENKIISLQHRLNQLLEERESLKQGVSTIADLKAKASRLPQLESEIAKAKQTMAEYEEMNRRLQQQLENLLAELLDAKRELDEEKSKVADLTKQLSVKQKVAMVQNGHHDDYGITNGYNTMAPKRSSSLGMIQVLDMNAFVRLLIYDMKPETAAKFDPKALPAYLIFMAIRYEDYVEQEMRVYEIFELATKTIKDVIRERFDFDTCILWLATTWRLYQLFKQYSGRQEYLKYSTSAQLEHVVKNQSLDDFEKQLEPLMSHLYIITVTDILEPMIATKIVPAILEHKETEKQRASKYRTLSKLRPLLKTADAMQVLLDQLTLIHDKFAQLGLDYPVISQLFSELMAIITSNSFNRLMFRRDFCTHAAAIQIKHNVTLVQNWLRDHNLSADTLQPLMEACHLLQARKTEQDIDGFHEMCSTLNVGQICRLLTHYKSEGVEAHLLPGFIDKVDKTLRQKRNLQPGENQPPLLSSSKSPTLEFSYVPSSVSLDTIHVPASLKSIVRKL